MNTRKEQVASIKSIVSSFYGVDPRDLDTLAKPKKLAEARAVAIYLCRELLKLSLPVIAEAFHRKDHGSTIWAVRAVNLRRGADQKFGSTLAELSAKVASILNFTNP